MFRHGMQKRTVTQSNGALIVTLDDWCGNAYLKLVKKGL